MADYEDVLYDNNPFAMSHPDHLATLGALFGMQPAPVEQCRVLELGCGLGGNLLPLAALFPDSEFIGVDLSQAQIAVGQADAKNMGLTNLKLHAVDIMDITPDWGEFDYIICHGVFSWVPKTVQERILAICQVHLKPQGLAYISYNCYPGWHVRGMIRSMLRRHVTATDPVARIQQARELLEVIYELTPADRNQAAAWLKREVGTIGELSGAYVLYEHLVDVNEPLWFSDFVDRIKGSGLQYVADAEFASMFPDRLGPGASDLLQTLATGLVETEQYLDYIGMRFFRRSIICKQDVRLDRTLSSPRLAGKSISTRLELLSDDTFKSPEGMVVDTPDDLLKAALKRLTAVPQGLIFETLYRDACLMLGIQRNAQDRDALGGALLELYASRALRVGIWPRPWTTDVGDHPVAPGFARRQAANGPACTNLMHVAIGLDAVDRALIARMDGRSRAELAAVLLEDLEAGRYTVTVDDEPLRDMEMIAELVDKKIAKIAKRALILEPRQARRYGSLPDQPLTPGSTPAGELDIGGKKTVRVEDAAAAGAEVEADAEGDGKADSVTK